MSLSRENETSHCEKSIEQKEIIKRWGSLGRRLGDLASRPSCPSAERSTGKRPLEPRARPNKRMNSALAGDDTLCLELYSPENIGRSATDHTGSSSGYCELASGPAAVNGFADDVVYLIDDES